VNKWSCRWPCQCTVGQHQQTVRPGCQRQTHPATRYSKQVCRAIESFACQCGGEASLRPFGMSSLCGCQGRASCRPLERSQHFRAGAQAFAPNFLRWAPRRADAERGRPTTFHRRPPGRADALQVSWRGGMSAIGRRQQRGTSKRKASADAIWPVSRGDGAPQEGLAQRPHAPSGAAAAARRFRFRTHEQQQPERAEHVGSGRDEAFHLPPPDRAAADHRCTARAKPNSRGGTAAATAPSDGLGALASKTASTASSTPSDRERRSEPGSRPVDAGIGGGQ